MWARRCRGISRGCATDSPRRATAAPCSSCSRMAGRCPSPRRCGWRGGRGWAGRAGGGGRGGPAGGVAASRYCARLLGTDDLIPFDRGGTSTAISLVVGGRAQVAADRGVAGHRVALPSLDIVSLGAGGGSTAWVGAGGAPPGGPWPPRPAGRGPARGAAAAGVHAVVNPRMAEGIRLVSVRRGVDPRRFALLAFGGAAGGAATGGARPPRNRGGGGVRERGAHLP